MPILSFAGVAQDLLEYLPTLAMTSGPAHRVSSGVEVYGFPQGHIGHLTEEEELALQEFKELCTEKGLYKGPKDDEYGTYDDATLLCVSIPRETRLRRLMFCAGAS